MDALHTHKVVMATWLLVLKKSYCCVSVKATELCKGKKVEGEKNKMGGMQNTETRMPILRHHSRMHPGGRKWEEGVKEKNCTSGEGKGTASQSFSRAFLH